MAIVENGKKMENNKVETKKEDLKKVSGGVNYALYYQCNSCGYILVQDYVPRICRRCGSKDVAPYTGPMEVNE